MDELRGAVTVFESSTNDFLVVVMSANVVPRTKGLDITSSSGTVLRTGQTFKGDVAVMDTARKKGKAKESVPPPPAVARRNARERNRVKQVNNGFANLRQHIPNFIAAGFESGRNGNKKLSKVETLRMAVEYIRSLEELLSDSTAPTYQADALPNPPYSSVTSPSSEDDNASNISAPPTPHQYLKVESSDGYQIVPLHLLQSNTHLKVKMENADVTELKREASTPLSPGIYSDSSLSPGVELQEFIPVFNIDELSSSPPTIKIEDNCDTASEEMRILCRNLIMLQADTQEDIAKQALNVNELISW